MEFAVVSIYFIALSIAELHLVPNVTQQQMKDLNSSMFKIKAELELGSFLLFCSCKHIRATFGIKCSLTTHERPRLELGFFFVLTSTSEIYMVHSLTALEKPNLKL
jgi:hypothetical protein